MQRKIMIISAILVLFFAVLSVQAQKRLAKPKNLRVEGDALVWDAVAGAGSYRVQWGKISSQLQFTTEEVAQNSLGLSRFSYNDAHYVKVKALSSDTAKIKHSRWTELNVVVRPDPVVAPNTPPNAPEPERLPAPGNIRLLDGSTVAWDAVAGADRYRIRLDPPSGLRILKRVNPPQTQYTFENLQEGLSYTVRVRAMGDEISYQLLGAWSKVLTLSP